MGKVLAQHEGVSSQLPWLPLQKPTLRSFHQNLGSILLFDFSGAPSALASQSRLLAASTPTSLAAMLFHVHTAPTPRALNSNCLKLHQIAILCLQVEGRQAVFGRKAGLKLCLKSSQLSATPHWQSLSAGTVSRRPLAWHASTHPRRQEAQYDSRSTRHTSTSWSSDVISLIYLRIYLPCLRNSSAMRWVTLDDHSSTT